MVGKAPGGGMTDLVFRAGGWAPSHPCDAIGSSVPIGVLTLRHTKAIYGFQRLTPFGPSLDRTRVMTPREWGPSAPRDPDVALCPGLGRASEDVTNSSSASYPTTALGTCTPLSSSFGRSRG
jgi:hypothetical protein